MTQSTVALSNLSQLPGKLAELFSFRNEPQLLFDRFLKLGVGLINSAGCAVISANKEPCIVAEFLSRQALGWSTDLRKDILVLASEALRTQTVQNQPLKLQPAARILCFPWFGATLEPGVVAFVVVPGEQPLEAFFLYGQLLAWLLGALLSASPQTNEAQIQQEKLLALFAESQSEQTLFELPSLVRTILGCSLVALGQRSGAGSMKLLAMTDVTKIDRRTQQSQLFEKAFLDTEIQNCNLVSRAIPGFVESPVIQNLCSAVRVDTLTAVPLALGSKIAGCLVCGWDKTPDDRQLNLLKNIKHSLTALLLAQGRRESFWSQFYPLKNGKIAMKLRNCLIAAAGIVVLSVPLPYRLKASSMIVPVTTRYVTARFDGILKEAPVQPGDQVRKGEILAHLDERDVDLELGRLKAERDKSLKLKDQYMGTGSAAQIQIADLDARRYQEQIRLLLAQKKDLTLVCPVNGFILSGDNQKRVGGPVTKGEVLFEVAPIEKLEVELAIQEKDISFAQPRQKTTLVFDAYPGQEFPAPLERITPRSQIRNNQNVFVGHLKLNNTDNQLRPGMKGEAFIHVGYRPLAWQLLRQPWYLLIRIGDHLL